MLQLADVSVLLICDRAKKFRTRIDYNGKKKHIGYYKTVEEAHTAYKEASLKYHGSFSIYNNK